MRDSEQRAFEERHGYPATLVPVAIDMIAVYVNKDNPIEGLSIPQVDAIFSATRACGYDKDINTWGDAGMTGAWANRDITLYSRNAVSGTYGFFKENALCGGDFRSDHQRAAGFLCGCARGRADPERHRLLRYRLSYLRGACGSAGRHRWR
jgi:phosphate transport system substrate-binding protein